MNEFELFENDVRRNETFELFDHAVKHGKQQRCWALHKIWISENSAEKN